MRKMLLVGTALSLSGCTVLLGEPIDQMVPFEGGGTRTFTFKKSPEQKIGTSEILGTVLSSMKNASELKAIHKKFIDRTSHRYRGVDITHGHKEFIVTHHDEIRYKDGKKFRSIKDNKTGKYPYEITETDHEYILTMKCPDEYHDVAKFRNGVLEKIASAKRGEPEVKQYITHEMAVANLNMMCINTNITINTSRNFSGEYNSKYSPDDISANFQRLLIKEIPHKYDLKFNILPYRGGSKITYKFKYPYEINSSINSYNSKEIEFVHKKIKAIIDD